MPRVQARTKEKIFRAAQTAFIELPHRLFSLEPTTYVCGIVPDEDIAVIQSTQYPRSICRVNIDALDAITAARQLFLDLKAEWHIPSFTRTV